MLDRAVIEHVVVDYKDILKDALENKVSSPTEIPYFDGDFWPNVLEELIKELDQEEEKRRRAEAELAEAEAEAELGSDDDDVDDELDPTHRHAKKKGAVYDKKLSKKRSNKNKVRFLAY